MGVFGSMFLTMAQDMPHRSLPFPHGDFLHLPVLPPLPSTLLGLLQQVPLQADSQGQEEEVAEEEDEEEKEKIGSLNVIRDRFI